MGLRILEQEEVLVTAVEAWVDSSGLCRSMGLHILEQEEVIVAIIVVDMEAIIQVMDAVCKARTLVVDGEAVGEEVMEITVDIKEDVEDTVVIMEAGILLALCHQGPVQSIHTATSILPTVAVVEAIIHTQALPSHQPSMHLQAGQRSQRNSATLPKKYAKKTCLQTAKTVVFVTSRSLRRKMAR